MGRAEAVVAVRLGPAVLTVLTLLVVVRFVVGGG